MSDQEEKAAAEAASNVERKPASIDIERSQDRSSPDNARDSDVIRDEKEAMRRKNNLSDPSDEAPEAEKPTVAEIESINAAIGH